MRRTVLADSQGSNTDTVFESTIFTEVGVNAARRIETVAGTNSSAGWGDMSTHYGGG